MVGLSRHADRFFKYLLILVEYSLGMTLFVGEKTLHLGINSPPELPPRVRLHPWGCGYLVVVIVQLVLDDLCWVSGYRPRIQRMEADD